MKKTKILMTTLLLSLSMLAVTACGKNEDSNVDTAFGSNRPTSFDEKNITSEKNHFSNIELFAANNEAVQHISEEEFLFTEDGLDFQIVTNKATIAYLRNDKDELIKYLSDSNYDTGLSEDSENLFDKPEYMILKHIDTTFSSMDNNGIYSVVYQYVLEGIEMNFYLDLGLENTDDIWKVDYICLQG